MPPARSVALQAGEIFERMAVLELCADPKINVDVAGRCSSRGQQRPCDGEPSVHMASDVRGEAKAGSQKLLAAAVAGRRVEQINFAVVHESRAANRARFFAAFVADHADVQWGSLRL